MRRCEILDPGKDAEGFEIDVCLRGADQKIACANDAAPQAQADDRRRHEPSRSAPTRLPSNVVLAPMAGVTDRPFRMLVPAIRRRARGLGNAHRRRAPVGHAEIAPAHGPQRRAQPARRCRSPASIRR